MTSDYQYQKETDMNKKAATLCSTLPYTYVEKRMSGAGKRGKVDLTGCSHGYRIELEGKKPGKEPTAKQQFWLDKWAACGAITGVYNTPQQALEIIKYEIKQRTGTQI